MEGLAVDRDLGTVLEIGERRNQKSESEACVGDGRDGEVSRKAKRGISM